MPVTLAEAGPRLAIGAWQSTYTVESLRVYPVLGSGGTDWLRKNPGSSKSQEAWRDHQGWPDASRALQKTICSALPAPILGTFPLAAA